LLAPDVPPAQFLPLEALPAAVPATAGPPSPSRRFGILRRDADGRITEAPASAAVLALAADPTAAPSLEHSRGLGGPGPEDRRPVAEADVFPARAIGMVYAVHGDTVIGCSGALIGPATVLTAAACVLDPRRGWPDRMLFVPGPQEDPDAAPGAWPWASATLPPAHLDGVAAPAIVTLAAPLGDTTGWLGFAAAAPGQEVIATLFGYPADTPAGSLWQASCAMELPGASAAQDVAFVHGCPGFAGIAGGAIHVYDPADGQRRTLGVSLPAAPEADGAAFLLTPAWVQWLTELWQ
jgi:protease YdgD